MNADHVRAHVGKEVFLHFSIPTLGRFNLGQPVAVKLISVEYGVVTFEYKVAKVLQPTQAFEDLVNKLGVQLGPKATEDDLVRAIHQHPDTWEIRRVSVELSYVVAVEAVVTPSTQN